MVDPSSPAEQQRDDAVEPSILGGTVYSAVTTGYDRDPLDCVKEAGVEFELRTHPAIDPEADRLWNREQKLILPPKTGLWSLYCDGSLSPKVPIRETVEDWLSKADMALFKHPQRTCAYDEIDACVARNKITAERGEKARAHLLLAGFPRHFGLWALTMIARRVHANSLQIFAMPMVWHHVQAVPRDQIWFPFVIWRLKQAVTRIHTIDADVFNNKWFSFRRHGT